ncbi:head-tail connector protein [Erythrobacter dokdonensis]|uniref:Uncharacterized protein n=1 Tax=Erythrobacter dokdonensis DSW-74 TaxID=1300349 RepID=A0A1A7BDW4_9SPHN|nr:hypothetical protein [Erythrobacter dokdonensis]OBV09946.1 hypothetical protein I603_2842 [Erythrobacter dokdonensis DSW-74]
MQRTIVQPPALGDAALAELKHWLGISRTNDDVALTGLLETSTAICEAFIGQAPLRQTVEEIMPICSSWHELVSRPVHQLVAATLIASDASRQSLGEPGYAIDWRGAGSACVRLLQPLEGRGVALQLEVGIAEDWASLPAPLGQGIIRLAAHHFRDREQKGSAVPPASVTALWRPWRSVRLG